MSSGRPDSHHELSRPSEWASAHKGAKHPPALTDITVDGEKQAALRFAVRPTHTTQSVVHSVLGVLFGVLAAGSVVFTVTDPAWDAVVGSVVLLGFAVAFLSTGLTAIVSARRGLGIDVTPTGLLIVLSDGRTALSWDDVTGVTATTVSAADAIVVSASDGTAVAVPCHRLTADPLVVFYSLMFYQSHPERRSELGSDAALSRIAERRLV